MRKGDVTRQHIIAHAAEVFNIQGYSGTSIADIMEATGLEKGGIYRHFSGKEELALAAFDYAAACVRQRLTTGIAGKAHAADALIAFVGVFRSYVHHPPLPGGCPILNTAIESDDTHPLLRDRARAGIDEWRTMLRTTLVGGMARGEVQPTVHVEKSITLIIAMLEGALMMSKLTTDGSPLQWAHEHLCDYINTNIRLNI